MKQISEPRSHRSSAGLRWLRSAVSAAVVLTVTVLADSGHVDPPATRLVSEWSVEIGHVYAELAAEQIGPAIRSWERARAAARASRQWQGLLAVGDAYLRIGDAVDFRRAFVATARDTYLEALDRARDTASVEGVLGAAAALTTLAACPAVEPTVGVAAHVAPSHDQHGDRESRRACESAGLSPWRQPWMNAKGDAS